MAKEETTTFSANTKTCATCQGYGILTDKNSFRTECPECRGHGFTKQIGDHIFVAHLPNDVPYDATAREQLWTKIKPWLVFVGLLFLASSAIHIYSSTDTVTTDALSGFAQTGTTSASQLGLIERFTKPTDVYHFIFWAILLLTLFSVFLRVESFTPPHLLDDLREKDEKKRRQWHQEEDGSIDIIPYFTKAALMAIDNAIILTERLKSSELTPEIFMASLLCSGKTALIVKRLELDPQATCKTVLGKIQKSDKSNRSVTVSPGTREIIMDAFIEAYRNGFNYVDVEDYLLAMTNFEGPYKDELDALGLPYEKVRSIAFWLNEELESIRRWQFWRERGRTRPTGYMNRAWTALPTPFLDSYSRDFTKLAALGNMPIVKVRDKEIDQVIRVLAAGEKNNALIVGEPGVGKTSIIGAVAAHMVEENVPEPLKDKRLIELDLSALVSGGRSEKTNLDKVLQEVKAAGNVILFIGHVESLVSKDGGLTGAALLEAAAKSAQLQIIGTSTFADYHRYIESNASFSNSFQKVVIEEVSDEDAITILEEESPVIQTKYKVLLTYPAIEAAVILSRKLIPDKVLPDKAIEVLSDAAQQASKEKKKFVTKADVQAVLSERSNVPVEDLTENERARLINLDQKMKERVIGQDEAVDKIAESLRRARAGLKEEEKPIGSFLFVGPTGVGKTETARTLAGSYFGSRDNIVRVDMSEYQDNKAIYRLIGAPASSASEFTEGGSLTKAVREKPYSIILLDEIEKAHPDVLNLFLQMLDDGRLTENTGRTVSFANTIIIATSNAGAANLVKTIEGGASQNEINRVATAALTKAFRPEFINRFDATVVFKPLSFENVQKIAIILLSAVTKKLKEQGVETIFANDVIAYVSKVGFDPKFGARPLKRAIADNVETKIADLLLSQQIDKSQKLVIDANMLGLKM